MTQGYISNACVRRVRLEWGCAVVCRGSDVMEAICDYYRVEGCAVVTERLLRSRENAWPIAEARSVLIYLWREDCGYSTYKCGWLLARNQSTAWRLDQDVRDALARRDLEIMSAIASVRSKIERSREVAIGATQIGHRAAGGNGDAPPAA